MKLVSLLRGFKPQWFGVASFLIAGLIFSLSAQAYDRIEHRFSAEGEKAKALYAALADDPRTDTDNENIVEMNEGIECLHGPSSCVTFTHDGDRKKLENSRAIYEGLAAVGANLSLYLSDVKCSEGAYPGHRTGVFFCAITERVSSR